MMIPDAHSAAECASVQRDEPVALHSQNAFHSGDDGDGGHAAQT